MIGGDAIHVARLLGYSAKEIPAAHHNGNLHTQ